MKKALITGGAGFIGVNLAERLLSCGYWVCIFDNLSRRGSFQNLAFLKKHKFAKNLKFVKGDIRDFGQLASAVRGTDVVFHLASQVAVTTSVVNPREDFEINALGSLNVLEASRLAKMKPVTIFASTNKVYGRLGGFKEGKTRWWFKKPSRGVSEESPLDFYSPYGCSKGAADQYFRDYFRIYKLPTVVFRQSCVYGPHQMGVEDQGWVAHFGITAMKNRPITIYGDGKQVRDILYVDDLIDVYMGAVAKINLCAGEIYNIGGGVDNAVSLLEYVDILEEAFGKKIKLMFKQERLGDQKLFVSDNSKLARDLNWRAKVNKEEGIKLLLDWVKINKGLFY